MRASLALLLAGLALGCGAAATSTTPNVPAPASAMTEGAPEPTHPQTNALPAAPAAVPEPSAVCAEYATHAAGNGAGCGADAEASRKALDNALSMTDEAARDAALAALEPCEPFAHGLMRALRAELAPRECGDVLVAPLLAGSTASTLRRDIREPLVALGLGARLARLVQHPPRLQPPFDKASFERFLASELGTWIAQQAGAIQELSAQGARLSGYAKGVVAVEAGLADMRFVETVRAVPLPAEMAGDDSLRDAYYGSLDQALEPRKTRGRDAALVGLREFAAAGVLRDARVDRARALLSQLWGGRRINALDGLLLPGVEAARPEQVPQRLAMQLPTYYAGFLLADADPTDSAMLRALMERGVPAKFRERLEQAQLSPEARRLWARALVRLGQTYWRSRDFSQAAQVVREERAGSDEAALLAALAVALKGGPKDAAEMMVRGPLLPQGVGNVADLDTLAAKPKSKIAGLAAFDAGYLLALVPPGDPDAAFWKGVAKRFERAAAVLGGEALRAQARDRAKAARDTAAAIR